MLVSAAKPKTKFPTIADVQERLGHIPEARILSFPAPGTATVQDLLDRFITGDFPHELVDGILVQKVCGWGKSLVSTRIGVLVSVFIDAVNLGVAAGAKGPIRLRPNLVRVPDLSFVRWDSVDDPSEIENPAGAFLEVPPDLAVEVLSPSNTRREMEIKLAEYAKAGVRLVWYVDPEREEVDVYVGGDPKSKTTLGTDNTLDGGDVLPGFAVKVGRIFESRAPATPPKKAKGKSKKEK